MISDVCWSIWLTSHHIRCLPSNGMLTWSWSLRTIHIGHHVLRRSVLTTWRSLSISVQSRIHSILSADSQLLIFRPLRFFPRCYIYENPGCRSKLDFGELKKRRRKGACFCISCFHDINGFQCIYDQYSDQLTVSDNLYGRKYSASSKDSSVDAKVMSFDQAFVQMAVPHCWTNRGNDQALQFVLHERHLLHICICDDDFYALLVCICIYHTHSFIYYLPSLAGLFFGPTCFLNAMFETLIPVKLIHSTWDSSQRGQSAVSRKIWQHRDAVTFIWNYFLFCIWMESAPSIQFLCFVYDQFRCIYSRALAAVQS